MSMTMTTHSHKHWTSEGGHVMETWGDKLDAIDFYIVLGETQPVSLRVSTTSEATTDEGQGGVQRHPGSVNFKVFVPTSDHRSTFSHEHTVTQDQFVRYAISGSL